MQLGPDYLRGTLAGDREALIPPCIPQAIVDGEYQEWGLYSYDRSLKIMKGMTIFWHTVRREMKNCLQVSGQGFNELRRNDISVGHYLLQLRSAGIKLTRFDIALDFPASFDIAELKRAFDEGLMTTKAKSCSIISSTSQGGDAKTVYLGSRGSDRYVRLYDKGAQLGGAVNETHRLELVLAGKRADAVFQTITDTNGSGDALARLQQALYAELKGFMGKTTIGALDATIDAVGALGAIDSLVPREDDNPDAFIKGVVIPFLINKGERVDKGLLSRLKYIVQQLEDN